MTNHTKARLARYATFLALLERLGRQTPVSHKLGL